MGVFLKANIYSVLVLVGVVVALLILYKLGKKDTVRKMVLALVVQAEKNLGSKTGELKYAMVIDAIYDKLPVILRFMFTREELDTMIEESVTKLKDLLRSGVTLTGYDDEKYLQFAIRDTDNNK